MYIYIDTSNYINIAIFYSPLSRPRLDCLIYIYIIVSGFIHSRTIKWENNPYFGPTETKTNRYISLWPTDSHRQWIQSDMGYLANHRVTESMPYQTSHCLVQLAASPFKQVAIHNISSFSAGETESNLVKKIHLLFPSTSTVPSANCEVSPCHEKCPKLRGLAAENLV